MSAGRITLVCIATALGAALIAGCGGGGDAEASTPDGAVKAYFEAISEADGETACGLLTDNALEGSDLSGLPASGSDCVNVVDTLAPTESTDVQTEVLVEAGTHATVKTTVQDGAPLAVELVKDGDDWRIESLAVSAVP